MFHLISPALAQAATSPIDPGTQIVGFVCQNQTLMASIVTIFGGRLVIELVSAGMKKFGITSASPGMAAVVPIIRAIALDVKPPDAVIVKNAETIVNQPTVPAPVSAAIVGLATAMQTPPTITPAA